MESEQINGHWIVAKFQSEMTMTKFFRVSRPGWVLVFALLIVLPTIAGAQSEIPLTAKSDETRKIFLEARQKSENIRLDEATQAQADNNPVKAIQLWEQLAQKFPNDKRAHYFLGAAY